MTYSQACTDLVKRFEDGAGFAAGRCSRLTSYLCPSGVWTIGWGHTLGVCDGIEISSIQADAFLREDLDTVARELEAAIPTGVILTQGEFDALCSLGFNVKGGPRALPHMAPRLWAALSSGDKTAAAREFLDIDKAMVNGRKQELPGLKARRQAESTLFLGETT